MKFRFPVCALLFVFSLAVVATLPEDALAQPTLERAYDRAYITEEVDGKVSSRAATPAEALMIARAPKGPLHVFGEPDGPVRANGVRAFANFNIILRGTAVLDANPQLQAAFERAAQIWESRITNPVTVFVDVDYGSTYFGGTPFPPGTLTLTGYQNYFDAYERLRILLRARSDNAAEATIYNALPVSSLPTDIGTATFAGGTQTLFRVLGDLPATAGTNDVAPSIGVNSAFAYDFDPSDGISPGKQDFEGLVVGGIGIMLGFNSNVGDVELGALSNRPTVLDWFRFRPGVTSGSFNSALRIQSSGGEQVYFAGGASLAMSTGRGDGTGGDGQPAGRWKNEAFTGVRIGLMQGTFTSGVRNELTENDLGAFGVMGYSIVNAPVPPSNLTATAISSNAIRLNWTDNSSNEAEFRIEQQNGSGTFVDIGSVAANATTFDASGFTAGQTGIFRVLARNTSGDSGYSIVASATTPGAGASPCVPGSTTVCLLNGRFRVSIAYVNPFSNPPNQPGTFLAARLLQGVQNPDTALFGFNSAQAVEVVVRIQDTRPFAPRLDLYYGGMTDVGYTVTVTDTVTNVTRQYVNTVGTVGGGVDRSSFPASALGPDDRMISSGGQDSFYDGSVSAAAIPAAPSNLTATATSFSAIRLNWQDNSSDENEFLVEQFTGFGVFAEIGAASANTPIFNVTGLPPGATGTFRVRARNASGDSGYSNEASAVTNTNPGPCVAGSTTVCLLSNRFRVSIAYVNPFSNPPNQPGIFLAARLLSGVQNPDTALFGFNSAQAVEVVVRVQDTRPFAPRFDIYYGGMTDVGYTVTVTDTQTGTSRQYVNTVGKVGGGVDRNSFPAN